MDIVQPMISLFTSFSTPRKTFLYLVFTFFILPNCLHSQCITKTTGIWSSPGLELFTAELDDVSVMVETATKLDAGLSTISNVSTSTTLTTLNPNWFSEPVAGNSSLQLRMGWDLISEPPLEDIDDFNDDKGLGTITFTFSEPVSGVTLHLDRIGGAGSVIGVPTGISNSVQWTVTTPGITLQKPQGSGTDGFIVTSTQFFKEPDLANTNSTPETGGLASQGATTGAAAGSVNLISNSPITTVEFEWTGIGVEGVGADELEIAITARPDCLPVLDIVKSVEDITALSDGSYRVNYLITIQNIGDAPLNDISLVDDLKLNLACAFRSISNQPTVSLINNSGLSISPSQNFAFNGITQTDIFSSTDGELHAGDELLVQFDVILNPDCLGVESPLTNEVILSGIDPRGIEILNQADVDLYLSRLELTKTADVSRFSNPVMPGDTIYYIFKVCNKGNGAISNLDVVDQDVELIKLPLSLSPGQCDSTALSGYYLLTNEDITRGQVTNSGEVTGLTENSEFISDVSDDPFDLTDFSPDGNGNPADPTVIILNPIPSITLNKIANTSEVQIPTRLNDPILYTFEICNTGSLELTNIIVTDPLVTVTGSPINVFPGDCNTTAFTGTYLINQNDINDGEIINTATVLGTSVLGDDVTDSSTVEVFLSMAPQIELIKRANSESIQNPTAVGDLIEYSFEVCNTGNVQLNNVLVNDDLLSIIPNPISLEIGECDDTSFSGSYRINAIDLQRLSVTNTAIASGESPTGIIVMDTSDDGQFIEDGDDNPTVVDLFPCAIDVGQLAPLQNECLVENGIITLESTIVGSQLFPPDFETFYLLSFGRLNRIIDIASVPQFNVNAPGSYSIHTVIAESSNPESSSYLNPALIIPGATDLADLVDYIRTNRICASIDVVGVSSLVSTQPVVELLSNNTICNSDELLMPTSIQFETLFESEPVTGQWSEPSLGLIDSDSIEFIGFQAGSYVFEFVSSNAVAPCVNVTKSTIVNVVDCFNECEELVCNEILQVSLGEECMLVPSPDQLLETPATGLYTITYSYDNGRPYGVDTLRSDAVGHELTYEISCAGNSCWGRLDVVGNNIPAINSPCGCSDEASPSSPCILWCQNEDQIASILISPEEALAQFTECGPEVLGQIDITTTVTGELCDPAGEKHVVNYSVKIIREGEVSVVDILCQTYWVQKFDVNVSDTEFNTGFGFPGDLALDCNYLDDYPNAQSLPELGSPASILWRTDEDSLSYPYYINKHVLIQDSVDILETELIEIGQQLIDTIVINEDGGTELITISKKLYDTIVSELRVPNGLAIHPLVSIENRICNLLTSFSDVEYESCGSGIKIVRTWTMVDWCDSEISRSANQTIEISDFTPPQIFRKQGDELVLINSLPEVQIGIDPWTCSASLRLPTFEVVDNCATNPSVIWSTDEGKVEGNLATDLWLEQSPISFTAYVFDDCDNVSELELDIVIIDDIAPIVQAETKLLVTLAYGNPGFNLGEAKVFAADLDEGSHDNGCGDVILSAVRLDDWEETVLNCDGEVVGFSKESSAAIGEFIDLGVLTDKNTCLYDSTNIQEVITTPLDFVKFNCDDVGLDIEVILFVTDQAGNQNQSIVLVKVKEESVPILICEDIDFTCDDLEDEDALDYEPPQIVGAACFNFFLQAEIASERRVDGACGAAKIVIEWFLDVDESGDPTVGDPFCTQFVEIETTGQVLKPETIKWPAHKTGDSFEGINIECDSTGMSFETPKNISLDEPLNCVPDLSSTEGPVWCDSDCGVVGTSVETDTLFTDDACMKLVRRWTVIDWCVWDPNSEGQLDDGNDRFIAVEDWTIDDCSTCVEFGPYDSEPVYFKYEQQEEEGILGNEFKVDVDGYYTFDQIIKVIDNTAPIVNAPDTVVVEVDISGVDQNSFGVCFGRGIIRVEGHDLCQNNRTQSSLDWSVFVKNEEGETLSDLVFDDPLLGPSTSSELGSPGDIHYVIWEASDGCGNRTRDTTVVVFEDLTPPIAVCVSAVNTTLNADIETVLWASEFNLSSYDNCTSPDQLVFSVTLENEAPKLPGEDNFDLTTTIEFGCEDAATVVNVDLWVWDRSGNGERCTVSISLQNSIEDCSLEEQSSYQIQGSIVTEDNAPILNADVSLEANLREYPKQVKSNELGSYAFLSNPQNQNYKLTVDRQDELINGLSTLDLVLIQRHILGLQKFNSPYKIIAADANADESVTVGDIVQLRKIILGLWTDLATNTAWKFIDKETTFVDTETPWPFTEDVLINDLQSDVININFIGVKIGDVNQDVKLVGDSESEIRNQETLLINIKNQFIRKGQKVSIPIRMTDENRTIHGAQFTLLHPGLTVVNIHSAGWVIDEFNYAQYEGYTRFSWMNTADSNTQTDLFNITFYAQHDLLLDQSLRFSDDKIRSEIYIGDNDTTYNLAIHYVSEPENESIQLGQSVPNPLYDIAYIPYYIPTDSYVEFSFYDVLGHVAYQQSFNQVRGNHVLRINASQFKQKGIIFYKMQVNNQIKSGRLSILN